MRYPPFIVRLTLLVASAALFAATVYRAATYPFTHDESLTYGIFTSQPQWGSGPNNHLLNTLLMRGCAALFGTSELSLRLPNVLALLVYLAFAILLLERFGHPLTRLAGFVLLALNPFVLDFFTVARGYGLALAFLVAALYFFMRGHDGSAPWLYAVLVAGAVSVTASYAFVNAFVPLAAGVLWLLMRRGMMREAVLAGAATGTFLLLVGLEVLRLGQSGLLFFGGRSGFVADTLLSLVRCTLYGPARAEPVVVAIVLAGYGTLLVLAAVHGRRAPLFFLLLVILSGSVVLPVVENALFGTRYPVERAALYYVPLFAVTLLAAFRGRVAIAVSAAIVVAGGWNFVRTFDVHTNFTWAYDAHNREVLEIVDRDRGGRRVRLGSSWMLEPSLNHYRFTRSYAWLAPLTRDPVTGREDYVYAFVHEVPRGGVVLASYPDTNTVLVRLNGGSRSTPPLRPAASY